MTPGAGAASVLEGGPQGVHQTGGDVLAEGDPVVAVVVALAQQAPGGAAPDGLRVVKVGSFDEGRKAVQAIGEGKAASLPTCG